MTRLPRPGRTVALTVLGLVALAAAACSSGTPSATPTTRATSTTTTAAPTTTTTTAAGGTTTSSGPAPHYEVTVGTVPGLGKVLVDGQGFTLYMFEPDHQSGRSTCYNECAVGWPPLTLPTGTTTPLAGPGIDASLLGTTKRTDGTVQVTYNRWPLYLWVNDSAPGQATGQGINSLGGLWYVLSPTGQVITTKV